MCGVLIKGTRATTVRRVNTIVLFRNDKKGNDKAPAFKGKVNIKGVEYQVAVWERKNGVLGGKIEVDKPKAKTNEPPY